VQLYNRNEIDGQYKYMAYAISLSKLNYDVLHSIDTKEHLGGKGKKTKNKRSPNVRT
jgi:hypothetical protein